MRGLAIVLAACGGGAASSRAPSNRAASAAIAPQHLATVVLSELDDGCPQIHRMSITIDGAEVAAIDAGCKPRPVPHNGIVITDSDTPHFPGPPIELAAGRHVVGVHDLVTGHRADVTVTAPLLGSSWQPWNTGAAADIVVVYVSDRALQIYLTIRDNIIEM
jgi:hypothetical protein